MPKALEAQKRKTGPKPVVRLQCIAPGCSAIAAHKELCASHYRLNLHKGTFDSAIRKRGTGTITSNGYVCIGMNGKKKQAHVLIVEALLGHALPPGAEIHHVDENKANNTHTNLVVCPSKAYHKMLHTRQDALAACGNASHRKCPFCKQYSAPEAMTHNKSSRYFYHAACKSNYNQLRKNK